MSGIASEMQKMLNDRYLAGLWLKDLPQGMCWYIHYQELQGIKDSRGYFPLPYVAPTWSWASAPQGVKFHSIDSFEADIEIISAESVTSSYDPFGQIRSSSLTLIGQIERIKILRTRSDMGNQYRGYRNPDLDSLFLWSNSHLFGDNPNPLDDRSNLLGDYHPDGPWMSQQTWDDNSVALDSSKPSLATEPAEFLFLGGHRKRKWSSGDCGFSERRNRVDRYQWYWVALGLEVVPGVENRYRRTGLAFGETDFFPRSGRLFGKAERRKIELV
ncbi:hypothetical protein MMC30_000180 [Trapelia coarctata]|nr:hypothetical protein [Trapelia coarctata]